MAQNWLLQERMFKSALTGIFLLIGSMVAPNTDNYAEKFAKHFKSKEMSALSEYFNSSIQLSTPSKDGVYSKSQATRILTEFLNENTPKDCTSEKEGNSDNGVQIAKLSLSTTSNKTYKILVYYRKQSAKAKVHQIKIE